MTQLPQKPGKMLISCT